MTPDERAAGVAATALATARIRAAESLRADRLFRDPIAVDLAQQAPRTGSAVPTWPGLRDYLRCHVVVRSQVYDREITAAVARGCRQVVLLAAGYDARAFRLGLPEHVTVFEVDQHSVLDHKAGVVAALGLTPTCRRVTVAADLRTDWLDRLRRAGHDPAVPTAWLAEGLLVYLESDAVATLLEQVSTASAPGSRLACEQSASTGSHTAGERHRPDETGDSAARWWRGGLDRPVSDFLGERGWHCRVIDLATAATACGRPVPEGAFAIARGRGFLVADRPRRGVQE